MISIKRFLGRDETPPVRVRLLQLLLQGISVHLVEGDLDDQAALRLTLDQADSCFSREAPDSEHLVQVGGVITAMGNYNRNSTRLFHQRSTEMQSMVTMLTDTVESIAENSQGNVTRLKAIGGKLAASMEIGDVRVLRGKLAECLNEIREESERQKEVADRAVVAIRDGLTGSANRGGVAVDQVTGLPSREAAEQAITEAVTENRPAHLVVLTLDRVQTYNTTFGMEVGDQVLQNFAGMLRRSLREGDRLFRWTGPTLVILIGRPNRLETIRDEITALTEHKFEHTVRMPTRTIHLPISPRWTVLPMASHLRLVTRKVDNFISGAHAATSGV